jgi:hypothetical protein
MARVLITSARGGQPVALLAVGLLLAVLLAGCSSSTDSASTTSTTENRSEGTQGLSTVCSETDLTSVEGSAAALNEAEMTLRAAAGNDGEFTSATIAFLREGEVFFSSLATTLDPFFAELAKESGLGAIVALTEDFTTAADDFAALATDIEAAGTVTQEDIAEIQAVNMRFGDFAGYVNPGSPSGDELRQIPACTTFLRSLDTATSAISSADGQDELDTED